MLKSLIVAVIPERRASYFLSLETYRINLEYQMVLVTLYADTARRTHVYILLPNIVNYRVVSRDWKRYLVCRGWRVTG
jgi:hypothetical protein